MAEHPRPQFWPHGYPQGQYVQQHPQPQPQPHMQPPFHGPMDARPHFFAGMPRPFAPQQQQQQHLRGQVSYGIGGYRPWGAPGPGPPHHGGPLHAPPGVVVRPAPTGFGPQMNWPESGRSKELIGDPRPVLSSSSTRGNGQLLKESTDLFEVGSGDGVREVDADLLLDPVSVNGLDPNSIMKDLQDLILRAERVVLQVLQSLQVVSATKLPKLVTCPSDSRHRVPPGSLFEHIFRCPSSPLTGFKDHHSLLSEMSRRSTEGQVKSLSVAKVEGGDLGAAGADVMMTAIVGLDSGKFTGTLYTKTAFDPWGGHFLYDDAPAVVQSAGSTVVVKEIHQDILAGLPGFLAVELGPQRFSNERETTETFKGDLISRQADVKSEAPTSPSNNSELGCILPSSFWALKKEMEAWKDFPRSYSPVVPKVLMGLGMLTRGEVLEWLLMNSPYYGVVLDMATGNQITYVVMLCLRAIRRESRRYLHKMSQNFSCEIFEASGNWLASQLEVLYGLSSARSLALAACKHFVLCSGRMLVSSFVATGIWDRHEKIATDGGVDQEIQYQEIAGEASIDQLPSDSQKNVGNRAVRHDLAEETNEHVCGDVCTTVSSPGVVSRKIRMAGEEHRSTLDDDIQPWQLQMAAAGIQDLAVLDQWLGAKLTSQFHSAAQLSQDYEYVVSRAVEERGKRPNMRAVLEHDGLVWNRNQRQDEKKSKTKEELLAEERDYKRRRMSYRGKKVRRSPTQVLHDIIEGHMREIVNAGGIGCFVKDGPSGKGDILTATGVAEVRKLVGDFAPKNEQVQVTRQDRPISRSNRGDTGTKSLSPSVQSKVQDVHRDLRDQRRHGLDHRSTDRSSHRSAHEVSSSSFEYHRTSDRYRMDEIRSSEQHRRKVPVERLAGSQRIRSTSGGVDDRWEGGGDGITNHYYSGSNKSRSVERYGS